MKGPDGTLYSYKHSVLTKLKNTFLQRKIFLFLRHPESPRLAFNELSWGYSKQKWRENWRLSIHCSTKAWLVVLIGWTFFSHSRNTFGASDWLNLISIHRGYYIAVWRSVDSKFLFERWRGTVFSRLLKRLFFKLCLLDSSFVWICCLFGPTIFWERVFFSVFWDPCMSKYGMSKYGMLLWSFKERTL